MKSFSISALKSLETCRTVSQRYASSACDLRSRRQVIIMAHISVGNAARGGNGGGRRRVRRLVLVVTPFDIVFVMLSCEADESKLEV